MNTWVKKLTRIYNNIDRIQNTKMDMIHVTNMQIDMQQHLNKTKLSDQKFYEGKFN